MESSLGDVIGILLRHSEGQIDFHFRAATLPVADHDMASSVRVKAGDALLGYSKAQAGRRLQVPDAIHGCR